jgi:hypothetical protein
VLSDIDFDFKIPGTEQLLARRFFASLKYERRIYD